MNGKCLRSKTSAVYDFSQENEDGLCLVLFPNNSLTENTDITVVARNKGKRKVLKRKKKDPTDIAKTQHFESGPCNKLRRPQRKCIKERTAGLANTPNIVFDKTEHMNLDTRSKIKTPESISTNPCESTPSLNSLTSVLSPMLSPVIKLSPINFNPTGTETNICTEDASQNRPLDSSHLSVSINSKLPVSSYHNGYSTKNPI